MLATESSAPESLVIWLAVRLTNFSLSSSEQLLIVENFGNRQRNSAISVHRDSGVCQLASSSSPARHTSIHKHINPEISGSSAGVNRSQS